MATEPQNDAAQEQPIVINAQYIKDLSFEAPGAPGVFAKMQEEEPNINVNVNVGANPIQDNTFEVVLELHAECKIGGEAAFLLELEYAGVFTVNVPQEHMQPVLLIECPRLMFPFARNILADVSRDGGFPPLMLAPLDFAGMFQARMQEAEAAMATGGDNDDAGADSPSEEPEA
ncbi:MAG: protein-export chaperone SecB [Alphaproteobacteria bacterium]|jgi:preprotein translocase subunit SecB|nr:protein-export chaperone SecB [Alphaproteobacteria bacterium]MBT7943985.1 protein-export chaperone SecB [Alphaproteobacteria bacterium]